MFIKIIIIKKSSVETPEVYEDQVPFSSKLSSLVFLFSGRKNQFIRRKTIELWILDI